MGFTELTYEGYLEDTAFWNSVGVKELPRFADDVVKFGGVGISALDFYDGLFGVELEPHREKEDYQQGEYGAIALERQPTIDPRKKEKKPYTMRRVTVTQDLEELFTLIDTSNNFCMMPAMGFAGIKNNLKDLRKIYALVIEIDGIIEGSGIHELFWSWQRPVSAMPKPTYIVCSGNGVHLYYVFEKPINAWKNVVEAFNEARVALVKGLWSSYVSSVSVQYETLIQPFRLVGTVCKKEGVYAMAFEVGEKVTVDYLNRFISDPSKHFTEGYSSTMSLEEARERFPEWYERRIVNKGPKRSKYRYKHPGIYYNWIEKILAGATVGHRYHCLEALVALAVQCDIPYEQLYEDCLFLMVRFEQLTNNSNNHFTLQDVNSALATYKNKEQAFERRLDVISAKTGIPLMPNRRNGRSQAEHLRRARKLREEDYSMVGRKQKGDIVAEWRRNNPNGKKVDCIRETGLSKPTVYKWWNN